VTIDIVRIACIAIADCHLLPFVVDTQLVTALIVRLWRSAFELFSIVHLAFDTDTNTFRIAIDVPTQAVRLSIVRDTIAAGFVDEKVRYWIEL
jgi:hypothetical protein